MPEEKEVINLELLWQLKPLYKQVNRVLFIANEVVNSDASLQERLYRQTGLELIKNVCEYAKVTNTKEFLITLVEEEEKIDARKQKRMHLRINTFPIEEATKEQIYNEHTLSTLVANDLNTILQFIHERFPKQVAAFEQKLLERGVEHSNPLDLFLYVLTQYLALSQLLAETAETAENKQN